MIVSEGRLGRVFVLRLGDGDRLPDAIEDFARTRGVEAALVAALGGLENGRLVTGPEDGRTMPPTAMLTAIDAVHEAAAVGTLFPGPDGTPRYYFVTKIKGPTVLLDGNHPLCGKTLRFAITVVDVREASAEEIAYQHVHGEHGHHH